jgi:hypothetical protein
MMFWMAKRRETKARATSKPGPKPETLKIDGNWQDAVRRSFQVKKPKGGWPKAGK